MNLTPVQINTDEFYHILRKRLFKTLPNEQDVAEVAQGYAKAVREAKQMDITRNRRSSSRSSSRRATRSIRRSRISTLASARIQVSSRPARSFA